MEKFKKDKLRMYAFLTACFIILVLLNSIGVFAESVYSTIDGNLNNLFVFPSLPMQNTDPDKPICVLNSSSFNYIRSYYQSDQPNFSIGSSVGAVNYGHYFMFLGASDNYFFYFLPDDSFVVSNNNSYRFYIPKEFKDTYGSLLKAYGIERGYPTSSFRGETHDITATVSVTIDGDEYYYYSSSTPNYPIIASDLPIYYSSNTIINSLDGLSQVNDNFTVPEIGESSSNNLDLPDGDWSFKNSTFTAPYNVLYNTGSVYPNGNITFSYTPSDYQVEHASDFTLTFGFTFDYDVNYKNWGGSDVGPFIQTSELTNNQKNYSAHWYYSNQGVEYIDVSLSDFIASGNSKSFTFYDILKNMGGGTYSYETVLLNSKELEYVSYNKFNITCTAFISSSNESSGNITEWYNPMNKKGYTTDESGKVNKNPYSDDSSTDVIPSGGGAPGTAGSSGDNSNNIGGGSGNSSATASNGSITINNTNNNTANGGSGSGGSGSGGGGSEVSESAVTFYTTFNPFKLIFNKLIGDNETISDETADTIGSNSFITLLSSTFTFIPSGVLTYLTWFFGACLSILIVAIVLRVLLDLL